MAKRNRGFTPPDTETTVDSTGEVAVTVATISAPDDAFDEPVAEVAPVVEVSDVPVELLRKLDKLNPDSQKSIALAFRHNTMKVLGEDGRDVEVFWSPTEANPRVAISFIARVLDGESVVGVVDAEAAKLKLRRVGGHVVDGRRVVLAYDVYQ